ncbi:MAG: LLM class flavin-dependent oxidoreductase, partial [Nocardioides sp.]
GTNVRMWHDHPMPEVSPPPRHGMTVPFDGQPLHAQEDRFRRLEALGYTDLWSAEAMGADGLTPLALGAVWTPSMRLGTAILPAFTRGPALMAQSIAGMASAAPGRFVAGIGSSSDVIVERWNGVAFEEPFKKTRDMVRFLRAALTGEKVTEDYDTFSVKGFRLGLVPEAPVPILVAGLREGMLRMAGRESDGAIVNWLSAENVPRVAGVVRAENPDAEIVARIFVAPTPDREAALATGKFAAAAYLNVPVYRAFHEWMGRGDASRRALGAMGGGRSAGCAGEDPGPHRRRVDRARRCRHVPGAHPALCRQRRDLPGAGDPPVPGRRCGRGHLGAGPEGVKRGAGPEGVKRGAGPEIVKRGAQGPAAARRCAVRSGSCAWALSPLVEGIT